MDGRSKRLKRANSGQIRVIEAFLAIFIVFSAFAISAGLTVSQKSTDHGGLAEVGFQGLLKLDSDGFLGRCISDKNWTRLRDALNLVLPSGVTFNLIVYNLQMQEINREVMSNGNLGSQNVAFTEFLCASQEPTFQCYLIHLYLAVAA
jgi:hypothetical protein